MSAGGTDRLIRRLEADLVPVRRLPRLRWSVATCLAGAALFAVAVLAAGGLDAAAVRNAARGGVSGPVGLGIAVAAACGLVAALAARIPGRESAVQWAGVAAALGLGGATGLAAIAWASGGFASNVPGAADRACLERALLLALAPTAGVLVLVARGWVGRPAVAAALGVAAGAGLGAGLVHLLCGLADPRHLLVAHVGATWIALAVATLPLALWLRRRAR